MDIFVSWSGGRSETIAKGLCDWIPLVLQPARPWMSRQIDKGSRWDDVISEKLEHTDFGIICLTPENVKDDWILFEAGALSKRVKTSRVCTLLFGLSPGDVTGPLSRFQHTSTDREDIKRLLHGINDQLGPATLDATRFGHTFDHWWPQIDQLLKSIPAPSGKSKAVHRDADEKIEEILVEVRALRRSQDVKATGNSSERRAMARVRDRAFDQRVEKWREFRASLALELKAYSEVMITVEHDGELGARVIEEMFDIVLSAGDRRIGIDAHVLEQLVGENPMTEFASDHSLHFARALNSGRIDKCWLVVDREGATELSPLKNLSALIKKLGFADRFRVIGGAPAVIAKAIVADIAKP